MPNSERTGTLLVGVRRTNPQPITEATLAVLNREPRTTPALALTLDCPQTHCRATAGRPCINPAGYEMKKVHTRRMGRAEDVVHYLISYPNLARWAD